MAVGVFSRCWLDYRQCCLQPLVHERISRQTCQPCLAMLSDTCASSLHLFLICSSLVPFIHTESHCCCCAMSLDNICEILPHAKTICIAWKLLKLYVLTQKYYPVLCTYDRYSVMSNTSYMSAEGRWRSGSWRLPGARRTLTAVHTRADTMSGCPDYQYDDILSLPWHDKSNKIK